MERRKLVLFITLAILIKKKKRRAKRSVWTKQWLMRNERGVFKQLINELRLEEPEHYRRYLRMDTTTFEVQYAVLHILFIFFSCLLSVILVCLKMFTVFNTNLNSVIVSWENYLSLKQLNFIYGLFQLSNFIAFKTIFIL